MRIWTGATMLPPPRMTLLTKLSAARQAAGTPRRGPGWSAALVIEAVMMPRVFVAIGLLCAIPHVAAAQTGAAPFCLQTVGGGVRCVFGTMGECERARANPSSSQCITRSDAQGTT